MLEVPLPSGEHTSTFIFIALATGGRVRVQWIVGLIRFTHHSFLEAPENVESPPPEALALYESLRSFSILSH